MSCHARPLPWRSARVTVTGFRSDLSFELAVVLSSWQTLRNSGSALGSHLPGTCYSNYFLLWLQLFKSSGDVVGPKHEARFQRGLML
jgi:hypothetical protein